MVAFNSLGAGTPSSFVLKNTTTPGSAGTTSQTGDGYSTGSTTGANGTAGANGTTGSNGANGTTSGADRSTWEDTPDQTMSKSESVQDRFLTLLVAQMRNQDPLNPLENAEVTSQMAQISTVEGIEKMNQTMARISEATGMNRASASTGLIGQDVLVPGNKLSWDADSGSMRSGVTLSDDATLLTVELFDASGKVVDQRSFANQPAGTLSIDWTGKGPNGGQYGPGDYTVRATVMSDTKATATTLTTARVTGVLDSAAGVTAQLANGEQIPISKINGVFQSRTGTTDSSRNGTSNSSQA